MNQYATRRTTPADRTKARRASRTPANRHLARVLDHQNIAPRRPLGRAQPDRQGHFRHAHTRVAQKPVKPHLASPRTRKPADAGARFCHKSLVKQGPPFSSRPSPNRPSSYATASIPASMPNHQSHRFSTRHTGQQRYVHAIAAFAGVTELGAAFVPLLLIDVIVVAAASAA